MDTKEGKYLAKEETKPGEKYLITEQGAMRFR
jgi:hypothetical protein